MMAPMENATRKYDGEDDGTLLAATSRGDGRAFEALYRRHQRRVFSIAFGFFGGDPDRAAEIAQQVFVTIFRKSDVFRGDSEFTTWVYRVTINACIDERRRLSRFFGLDGILGLRDERCRPEDLVRLAQASTHVRTAVASLRPKYRIPIVLKYTEGLGYQQIAEVLGISIGTVSSRIHRAHTLLAKKLEHLRENI